ncbi:hypothetical protein PpBr36_03546 [Pyricularia pennisetigena]|uniref:hypothetical protein n=1 Tax=Pyricularia pennisetigena TaxID=1578925 RepID=UPI0011515DD6|nr:hypothetical protein PpBr36_03546 [Pyricularia pennisetigena]TLS29863.1 hypothetical protein PpBr36_03546 [Pyricularia pennisetigena]
MTLPGSPTATLSPSTTASDPFNFRSSISSLTSSNSSRRQSSNVSKTYRQASTLFLTRRLPEALSTVLPLVTPPGQGTSENVLSEPAPVAKASRNTRVKVWSLYLTTLNAIVEMDPAEGKASFGTKEWRAICSKVRDGEIWEEVVRNGYHGIEGDVDSDVVINLATLLLAHANNQGLNQKRLETYLAASNTPSLDLYSKFQTPSTPLQRPRSPVKPQHAPTPSGADTPRDLNARVKILELYTLHVLIRNNEWDYAREFISVSSVLDDERREAFLMALQSLQEEHEAQEAHEKQERQKQEDQLRRDLEEARRLRAENEERERRRLEEERVRREGSEVDYGIEETPGRVARSPAGGTSRKSKPQGKDKRAAAAPSFAARAAIVITNLKGLVERMSASIHANPGPLLRMLAFIVSLLVIFGQQRIRERVSRILGNSWSKVKATAGMGVKASYI